MRIELHETSWNECRIGATTAVGRAARSFGLRVFRVGFVELLYILDAWPKVGQPVTVTKAVSIHALVKRATAVVLPRKPADVFQSTPS